MKTIFDYLKIAKRTSYAAIDLFATGDNLRMKRRTLGLTQDLLSELFEWYGLSATRVTISNWERGLNVPPTEALRFLAWLYQCSMDELLVSEVLPCNDDAIPMAA